MVENYEVVINSLLKCYNIGNSIENIEILSGGFQNINIKFKIENKEYVLKIYSLINFDLKKISQNLKFLYELKTKYNYPVAEQILTKEKEYILKLDKKYYSISKFIEGDKFEDDFSIKKIESAGKTLALLHKATIKNKSNENVGLKVENLTKIISLWDVNNNKEKDISLQDRISEIEEKDEVEKSIIKTYIPYVKNYLKLLKDDLKHIREKNEIAIIHGDYWGGNLIFNKNKVSCVLDWDYSKYDYPEYDLVRTSMIFGFHHNQEGFQENRFKVFLDSYKKVMKNINLKGKEILAFLRYSNLSGLSLFIEKYAIDKSQNEISNIKGFIELLDWISDNEEMIINLFE